MNNQFNEALPRQPGQCPEIPDAVVQPDIDAVCQLLGEKPNELGRDAWERAGEAWVRIALWVIGNGNRVTTDMVGRNVAALLWTADPRFVRPDGPSLKEFAKHLKCNYAKLATATGEARRRFGLRNSYQIAQKDPDPPGGKKKPRPVPGDGALDKPVAYTATDEEWQSTGTNTLDGDVVSNDGEDGEEGDCE